MSRGGLRFPKGGRPKGSLDRKTIQARKIAQEAAEQGLSPLEFALSVMRDESQPQHRRDQMCAMAMPFVHPKLTMMHVSNDKSPSNPLVVEIINVNGVPSGHFLTDEEAGRSLVTEIFDAEVENAQIIDGESATADDDSVTVIGERRRG